MTMLRAFAQLLVLPLLTAAAPASEAPLAGDYMLVGVREAAGGLQLGADGRFRYGFSYGALDEQAEGRWRQEGNRILLTTDPAPKPPEWTLVARETGEAGVFGLILEGPNGAAIPNIGVQIRMADGSEEEGTTQGDWLEAELGNRVPVSVRFRIPVFDLGSPDFAVDVRTARRYRFRLEPRDLGVRDFRDWPLEIRGDLLVPTGAPEGQGFRRMTVRD